ncbi:MAG: helix-turn-helix domain-containing protein, partial [Rickettsiales bacterium]
EPADSNLPAWADDALPIATKGEYLRALRNLSGDSREQLAERCGYDAGYLRTVECGFQNASENLIAAYARYPLFNRAALDALPAGHSNWLDAGHAGAVIDGRAPVGDVATGAVR